MNLAIFAVLRDVGGTLCSLFLLLGTYILIRDTVEQWLSEIFSRGDLSDCFPIEIRISRNGSKIEVFLDSDTGLTLGKCQKISRLLEKKLDEIEYSDGKYVLEVSSPGASKPLVNLRQYKKHIGRSVKIETVADEKFTGKLTGVENDHIILERELSKKESKRKGMKFEPLELNFDQIKTAIINISFK